MMSALVIMIIRSGFATSSAAMVAGERATRNSRSGELRIRGYIAIAHDRSCTEPKHYHVRFDAAQGAKITAH
jgi:hypothetical protein